MCTQVIISHLNNLFCQLSSICHNFKRSHSLLTFLILTHKMGHHCPLALLQGPILITLCGVPRHVTPITKTILKNISWLKTKIAIIAGLRNHFRHVKALSIHSLEIHIGCIYQHEIKLFMILFVEIFVVETVFNTRKNFQGSFGVSSAVICI